MLQRVAVVVAVGVMGCVQPRGVLEVGAEVSFEPTQLQVTRTKGLPISNLGDLPLELTVSLDNPEFTASTERLTVYAHSTTELTLRFTPTSAGTRRTTLSLGDRRITLHGEGTRTQLDVANELTLQSTRLVPGEGSAHATGTLRLRNTGTRVAPLIIKSMTPNASSLCVGESCAGITSTIPSGELLEVPLDGALSEGGEARWKVTIVTDDPAAPIRIVAVRAVAEALDVCDFELPASITLTGPMPVLELQHHGPGRCALQAVTFDAAPGVSARIETAGLPAVLEPSAPFPITFEVEQPGATRVGLLHVVPSGRASIDLPVFMASSAGALTVTPSQVDFGRIGVSCSSPERLLSLYNTGATALVLQTAELQGDGAFSLVSPIITPITLAPGSTTPFTVRVSYHPVNAGVDDAVLRLITSDGVASVIGLHGVGAARTPTTDRYVLGVPPRLDAVFIVDTSPSFAPRKGAVRSGVQGVLTVLDELCFDTRVAFLPAEGAAGASVHFARSDAGEVWTSWKSPDFVGRALSAFDALPGSSETEACIGPASQLLPDAGVRPDSVLQAMCITDALEHSLDPQAALASLKQTFPRLKWDAYTGVASSTCAVEAVDDGVHQQLVGSTAAGVHFDVCIPAWEQGGTTGDICLRTSYFVSGVPEGGAVTVTRNGLPATQWHFDVVSSAVIFDEGVVQGGDTIELTWVPACTP